MRQIVVVGCAVLAVLVLAGSAAAGDQIDTSNILVLGYYSGGTEIDLSQAIQEFDRVTETTGQYVEGIVTIWFDNPEGRNPGDIQEYERRDDVDTNIPFATDISVRVKSDGWIVAWLTNYQDISDIVFWNDANADSNPSDTTIGKAIWRITDRVGVNYYKDGVKYYSYKYPAADKLLIGGRMIYSQSETYYFLIPSATTVYKANFVCTVYLYDESSKYSSHYSSGKIKIDDEYVFNKSTTGSYNKGLYEYARYNEDIATMTKDTRHTVYLTSYRRYSRHVALKSAVVILYK